MSGGDVAPIEVVIELLTRLAGGHYDARATATDLDEDLDAVILGINMLAEELEASRAQLEDRVQERTLQLEVARVEAIRQVGTLEQQELTLQSALKVKENFMALVSHELRTPLTSIIGYVELIDDFKELMPETALQYLTAIERNSDRLLGLVTALLTASEVRNTPTRLMCAPVDLSALTRHCLDGLRQRANEAGLTMTRDVPPRVEITADGAALEQVVVNLVCNAIKFTPADGQISVALRQGCDGVELIVRDTGMGIEAASLPYVTTEFFRTPSATAAAIPGVGLGLMITNSIVVAHHGTLTFTSREGEGTSAHVRLPKGPPQRS